MFKVDYNPDVLSCLANLSNDEVFTPPALANEILDMLPKELWTNKETTFLAPVSKSGVFLREIAKRLIVGLEDEMPDMQTRVNHILKNQLFGIAITELTSLLSRRSLYCSKTANGKYSICNDFDTESGNILFDKIQHKWKNGKCDHCSASQGVYDRDEELETHAYHFIHTEKPEELFNMKFDVIIGNPPYQLDTAGYGRQAKPIYHKFVEQAKKLNPRYLIMITPSRWFSGGMGLDEFRVNMLNDKRLQTIVDFINSKDCFPGVSISGGVSYFLWDSSYNGKCEFINKHNSKTDSKKRYLNEFPILVRYNQAINIISKIRKIGEEAISSKIRSINVFNIASSFRGYAENNGLTVSVRHSKGIGYIKKENITSGIELIAKYKVAVSRTIAEHAGEPSKNGDFKVLARIISLKPNEVCTHSYLIVGIFDSVEIVNSFKKYLTTKFARFLILQAISGIDLSKERFQFVPIQDFSESWTDKKLYKKYDLNQEEIDFIESIIRPMEPVNE